MEWTPGWSCTQIDHGAVVADVENLTQQCVFANNLRGTAVRVLFSNRYGTRPLRIEAATASVRSGGGLTGHAPLLTRPLELAPGEEAYSAEAPLQVNETQDIVVSVYVAQAYPVRGVCSTWSAQSWQVWYQTGDHTADSALGGCDSYTVYPAFQAMPNRSYHLFGLCSVDVRTDGCPAMFALFGDSITHMSYYHDALLHRLRTESPGRACLLNRGIGGNRLLLDHSEDPLQAGGGVCFGRAGRDRFEQDVFGRETPDCVGVLIGINDFSHPYAFEKPEQIVTCAQYVEAMQQLARTAHAHGSRIYAGTILPFYDGVKKWFAPVEALREEANAWIRSQTDFDGVVDFDLALRRPEQPCAMRDDCHIGDRLHPNAAGGSRMAACVPLNAWFPAARSGV